MAAVILAYDQLLFRPIVAWADKFRFEQTAAAQRPRSWVYDLWRRGKVVRRVSPAIGWMAARISRLPLGFTRAARAARTSGTGRLRERLWLAVVLAAVAYALWRIVSVHAGLAQHRRSSGRDRLRLAHARPASSF